MLPFPAWSLIVSVAVAVGSVASGPIESDFGHGQVTIKPSDPLIYFHGRWDASPGTWWAGSGLKLHVSNLSNLTLTLGPLTTQPTAAVGVSVDYEPFRSIKLGSGLNVVPLGDAGKNARNANVVVRLNVEGWQNNRIQLQSIGLNQGAKLLPYIPQPLNFQVIGDSLTAGQFLDNGVDGGYGFLLGETFKAEHNVQAQPGACLTDQLCWGNAHGVSYQYFKTEDTGYFYTTDHNYTTDWDFRRDLPPTHIFINIGANDNAYSISNESFVSTYSAFIARLRKLYPFQPIFVLGAWGWPSADGSVYQYYPGQFQAVVEQRKAVGDKHIYFIDTTGWVTWDDVFPENQHPSASGHKKIAGLLGDWLGTWGLHPVKQWASQF